MCRLLLRTIAVAWLATASSLRAAVVPDLSGYSHTCEVLVKSEGARLQIHWPVTGRADPGLTLDLSPGTPLITSLDGVLHDLDPVLAMTVGSRVAPEGRPPTMSIWNTFFDNPAKRPHESHLATFEKKSAIVKGSGSRATVTVGDIKCDGFSGEISFTIFAGSPLVEFEAIVSTAEDTRAFIFDLGLAGEKAGWKNFAWTDTEGNRREAGADESAADESFAVRHRMLACEGATGSVAMFPPPHQFFFPVDRTTNNKFFWRGRGHQGERRFGFGIRQDPEGGGNYVPWFNGPPGTKQHLSLFLLLDPGNADQAMTGASRFTRGDRFAQLPGMTTYTSHYHMAVAMTAMDQKNRGVNPLPMPEFVKVFHDMNVQALHLGEFHGDGHPQDHGPQRLPEMEMMFSECARLSDDNFLLIPGEEANSHLGIPFPGRHPGHWMLLFPKPVYWTMAHPNGKPFEEDVPPFGKVYHVGSRDEMVRLIRQEHGLAWTAHARIKASSWTPDIFRNEEFFKDNLWLGAAWKAMPADLSRERLGERCLDLLDDMCNWGDKKYLPGEVDVFKIDHTHELYGHMNINYLRLPKLPRQEEGWQPILEVLRRGEFFTTTGEILIRSFTIAGKESGATMALPANGETPVSVALEWTFPLKFAEIISGDGEKVFRDRIDLGHTGTFGTHTLDLKAKLTGRKWVRFEVWDIASNGAYTQPVWIESGR